MKKILRKISRFIDRTMSGTIGGQLLFFSCVTAFVFLALFVGSFFFPTDEPADIRFWHIVFNFIDVGGFEEDTHGIGWGLLFLINFFGIILFGGMLVSVLTNIIERRIDRVKEGDVYYDFENHTIIIGYDPLCPGLIRQLAGKQKHEIVLLTSRNVPEVRHELFSSLGEELARDITIVSGNRTSSEDIAKLHLASCTQVFLLGEAGEEDRDSQNIECLNSINALLVKSGKYIRCHVLFEKQATFTIFQQQDIQGIREYIDFVPFNFCDLWAQKVFINLNYNNGAITYTPLDREPISPESDKRVHLVILGMTNMGIALGVQAAHLCHFPNFDTKRIRTRITFIDEQADREFDFFKTQYRNLLDETDYYYWDIDGKTKFDTARTKERFTDIEFEFIKGHFERDEVQNYLGKISVQQDTFLTIAVAIADASDAIACGLYLPEVVYNSGAQILIRQELSYGALSMLTVPGGEDAYHKYKNVKSFGMLENCYDLNRADDILPMMVKYTYDNTDAVTVTKHFPDREIRQNWTKNWKPADNVSALKASNRYCANFIPVKQRSLGIKSGEELSNQQINHAAFMEHNRWVMEKLLLGFRAPTEKEAASIGAEKKRGYYKARLIHEDIKAYGSLGFDDKNIDVKIYDINISRALPFMLETYKRIKNEN